MTRHLTRVLRAEGLAEAALGIAVFAALGESWWLFCVAVLLPDVSLVAYVAGARTGAIVYNMAHSTVVPCLLAVTSIAMGAHVGLAVAAAWLVHIGVDRALGYGLKAASGFKDTHLGALDTPCASR